MRLLSREELSELVYIFKRLSKAKAQSIPFYLCRVFRIKKRKIVFTTIEGTTGFTCNPKYIALEMIRRNRTLPKNERWEMIWLLDDMTKPFPKEIGKVKNTLLRRAYHLSTARFWIDNSRKQLECRKRKNQTYIQTWHAKIGFKPTGLDRGASFTRIAYLVTKHDSDMIDLWLSNSDWYDQTLPTGSLYEGEALRSGSPRCDVLINRVVEKRKAVRKLFSLPEDAKILMYAPTFRGGSQHTERTVEVGENHFPDYMAMKQSLETRFGGTWYIMLRLHPQLVARGLDKGVADPAIIDGSRVDDMYEILAGCDAFMTDYSSAAFDAAAMRIPIFLYADDYSDYENERGTLLWDLKALPFPLAENDEELKQQILDFDGEHYDKALDALFAETGMVEDGKASKRVCDWIERELR